MEVCAEAKRVMMQALSKMYSSRNQRGGIPLHRSLLLSLVMRAARDAYHSARVPNHGPDPSGQTDSPVTAAHHTQTEELMDTAEAPEPPCALQSGERTLKQDSTADKENCNTTGHHTQSRKRRGKGDADPDFLPCKKARLDPAEFRRVLHESTARSNSGNCAREADPLSATHIPRTIVTC
ncbi:immediate early response gene 2 protein [Ictalurus furcatus]|uniref:immediate early response gene 2 protein n=1 Tax=Ictalurus furcatus TaxID=66913 RepID=UPI002350D791|nr:immediate early response gene 2 protein [Ictalurus furcatus]